ncbi:MAG: FAD-binding oxidoreductase [Pseudomonadota bacterium]
MVGKDKPNSRGAIGARKPSARGAGGVGASALATAGVEKPKTLKQVMAIMDPANRYPVPIRPMGANSASTQCTAAVGGTLVDMTGLNEISQLTNTTVTAGAGVTLRELADYLAERDLEIAGSIDLVRRTVGGVVASGCFGPSHNGANAFFASQVAALKVVTPTGKLLAVDDSQGNLLRILRLSMGVLGIIVEVTFRIRPIQTFTLKQRKMDIDTFSRAVHALGEQRIGIKFFYLPFKDTLYTELRRAAQQEQPVRSLAWHVKDWGESAVLPSMCSKLSRIVPIASIRYGLVDGLHGLGHSMLTNTLTESGSSAVEFRSQTSGRFVAPPLQYSSWCFPVDNIDLLLGAYRAFAQEYYRKNKFRCDMPLVGVRLPADQSGLLSPCFEQPMFALRVISNPHTMWEDFAMDFAEFAQRWGGVPLFNQSRCAEPVYANAAFGTRLDFFRKIRRQMDPDDRMLNPFLAQYLR